MTTEPTGKERRTSIALSKETRDKLNALRAELGFKSITALFNYAVLELTREGLIPPVAYSVIFGERTEIKDGVPVKVTDTRPAIITGSSGAGKTTAVRELLSQWKGPVFILDVTDEYPDFRKVDLGRIFSMDWAKAAGRFRFVPNKNVEASKGEASAIFGHLNYLKSAGALSDWAIVIEEGHRFSQDPNLRALLIEGRKFCRKVLLVTTDWEVFRGIAKVYKPRPWEPDQTPSDAS